MVKGTSVTLLVVACFEVLWQAINDADSTVNVHHRDILLINIDNPKFFYYFKFYTMARQTHSSRLFVSSSLLAANLKDLLLYVEKN
tara:strand:- start:170 stop:427 length:258 start_codon:yes stop_codon:yes gene_type:complete